jgi:Cu+-exporting ATPase
METIQWKVDGMDCSNCALTIHKYLEKQGGRNIRVNFATGDVCFDLNGIATEEKIAKGINDLGYAIKNPVKSNEPEEQKSPFLSTHLQRFLTCLPFTSLLVLPMIPGIHLHGLMNPWLQFALTLPVYAIGMSFFGKSAYKSIRNGMPNMNVLIAIGSSAAFIYSVYGTVTNQAAHYMFYETAAAVITLVFLGNYLEDYTVATTQRSLQALVRSQKMMANMIAYDDAHNEHIFPVENTALKVGDLILILSGEQVPIDCKILWGEAHVNEAIITGESVPVRRHKKDKLVGGSILHDGSVKAQVTATGDDTVLSGIIHLVKQAQGEKPPVQQLADKISAVFVPVVLGIAAVTLVVNWFVLKEFTPALMRSIAVLVIACPCAMGLATPAAIAVGLGRSARNGILFRSAKSLELFKDIKQVVFDKTGTLTTGKFTVSNWKLTAGNITEEEFKQVVFSLEKYSNHPIAHSITAAWRYPASSDRKNKIRWKEVEEIKGLGVQATDADGNSFKALSFSGAKHLTNDGDHSVYVLKNNSLIGWIDVVDEVRPEAKTIINYFRTRNIRTVLLSGDRYAKAKRLADELNMDEVFAEQSPEQKLKFIGDRSATAPTIMVGDGINDAPALAKATIGISMSDASHIAMQTAQVVLMNHGLKNLPMALGLGKHTYRTIKENLFWAFIYNIVAIPVAALGFLTPAFGALVMAFSDVILAVNSSRLFVKKVV